MHPSRCSNARWRCILFGLPGALVAALWFAAQAGPPRIDYIELFRTNEVLVHFDTEPNLTYILQYKNSLASTNPWVSIFTAFAYPFPNHFIVVDERTTPQRFYRLSVEP